MIKVRDVTKYFGSVKALDGLNLSIGENEIYGFVGDLGSGKTTAMKILCGLLLPTEGSCKIEGIDVSRYPQKIKPMVGYVPDFMGVYENLKIREYMNFFALSHGLSGTGKEEKIYEVLENLGLTEYADCFVEDLTRNMKKRLCIARALVHEPKILLLDEPFSGLSMSHRMEFGEFLKQLNSLGYTIVITAYTLSEVSGLCSSVAAFEEGKAVMSGSVLEIEKRIHESNPIIMKMETGQEAAIRILKEDEKVSNLIISEDNEIIIRFDGNSKEEGELLKKVILGGGLVTSFSRKVYDMSSML